MQWAWAIYLFVSPQYSQSNCSGETIIIMFLAPFKTRNINSFDSKESGARFLIWPAWLLFCVGTTLVLTIILAVSSSDRSIEVFSRPSAFSASTGMATATPTPWVWAHMVWESLPPWRDRKRQFTFWCNFLSFIVWGAFVVGELHSDLVRYRRHLTWITRPQRPSFRSLGTASLTVRTTLVVLDR